MSVNQIGIRQSNVFLPYTAATKRTKIITISSTSFLTVTGTNITGNTILGAYMYAYADSTGKWRLSFNFHCPVTSTGVRGTANFTLLSTYAVTFKSGPYQAVASFLGQTGDACTARTTSNTAIISLLHASSNQNEYQVSGDVELESEPTWAAANMEGVLAADVFIPPAAAGIAGLVNNTAGNTVGTPILGRTDGQAVAAGYVGHNTYTSPSPFTGSTTRAQIASLTLTPGTWLMSAVFCNARTNAAVGGTYLSIAISTTAGNSIAGCVDGYDLVNSGFNAASGFGSAVIPSKIVNISANTTYYLNGATDHIAANDMVCSMSVVRIA